MAEQANHGADGGTPKIEFPCDNYSIKVVGRKTDDYSQWVIDTVTQLAPDLDPAQVQVVDSRNGRFQSVRLSICAQHIEQLQAIHSTLVNSGRVQIVL